MHTQRHQQLAKARSLLFIMLLCAFASSVVAESTDLPADTDQTNTSQATDEQTPANNNTSKIKPPPRNIPGWPANGMTMKQVEQQYGKPVRIRPATGKPPITRWIYQDFTVYFEGRYVIHSVKIRIIPGITDRQPNPPRGSSGQTR